MSFHRKKSLHLALIFAVIVLSVIFYFVYLSPYFLPEKNIVLSPHYDDAVLSLGGFISHNRSDTAVVTFFTENASTTQETKWDKLSGFASSSRSYVARSLENYNALRLLGAQEINFYYVDFQYRTVDQSAVVYNKLLKSIETLIQKNKSSKLNIYGPAYFGDNITHPDHKLLHDAFIATAKIYANNPQITFFMYEDFPYIQIYHKKNILDFKSFAARIDNIDLTAVPQNISMTDVTFKEQSLAEYASQIKAFNKTGEDILSESRSFTSTRCGKTPCEMVYKIDKKAD